MRAQVLHRQFVDGTLAPGTFGHREHLLVAYEILSDAEFLDACVQYTRGVKSLAARAGAPGKFNMTLTIAFLSLIAERMFARHHADAEAFLEDHPELTDPGVLAQWYPSDVLSSEAARHILILPANNASLA